jgi:hypothetical protein
MSSWDSFAIFVILPKTEYRAFVRHLTGYQNSCSLLEAQDRTEFMSCLGPGITTCVSPGTKVITVPKMPSWSQPPLALKLPELGYLELMGH